MKKFIDFFRNKKVLILGFGVEGKSSYKTLRHFFPDMQLYIADINYELPKIFHTDFKKDENVNLYYGDNYLNEINTYGLIIKSPGISYKAISGLNPETIISSQTEIFIRFFKKQIIGVTGTKGKSTTTSLLAHILKIAGKDVLLAGNIGIPPFDLIDKINKETIIAYEMSSHQLENINVSPHIAILLNIYQEHLDHYSAYDHYKEAKLNIARWQTYNDIFIMNLNNESIAQMPESFLGNGIKALINDKQGIGSSCKNEDLLINNGKSEFLIKDICINRKLAGDHNLVNIQAASLAAFFLGIDNGSIIKGIKTFEGLPHRLEEVATINGAIFINDSISTIPEATIAAIETYPNTNTLILGGFDRGVCYDKLVVYLSESAVKNLIFLGKAGKRMQNILIKKFPDHNKNCQLASDFDKAVELAKELTENGKVCILSPAASSYDVFKNFQERGDRFRFLLNV